MRACSLSRISYRYVRAGQGDGTDRREGADHGRDRGLAWNTLPGHAYVATWDVNVYNAKARRAGRPPYSRSSFTPLLGYDVKADGPRPRLGLDAGIQTRASRR